MADCAPVCLRGLVRLWRRFGPVFGKLEITSAYYQRGLTDLRISDGDIFMAS